MTDLHKGKIQAERGGSDQLSTRSGGAETLPCLNTGTRENSNSVSGTENTKNKLVWQRINST